MFNNLIYKFQKRNSKKNLKKEVEKLNEQLSDLRKETIGHNRNGWVTFTTLGGKQTKDESLYQKFEDICEYLGIEYTQEKLASKPKEKK